MVENCTCGANIIDGALFCYKCGRPLRESVVEAAVPEPVIEAPPPVLRGLPEEYLSPHFQNPIAIRAAWIAAFLAVILNLLLVQGFAVWLVAAGFLSVWLFMRRARTGLTVRAGARMGWITGILSFMIETVVLTINTAYITSREGGIAQFYRSQIGASAASDPNVQQALKLLESSPGLVAMFVAMLVFLFTVITLFCTAGGALGAKVLARD